MPEMKFTLPGPDTVTLAGQTIDKLISAGDGGAALLYLYILKARGENTSAEAAAALGKDSGEIETAMAVLSRLGLVQLDAGTQGTQGDGSVVSTQGDGSVVSGGSGDQFTAGRESGAGYPEEEPRKFSVQDMKKELQSGSVFFSIVEEAHRSLGKILSPDELLRLFGIYDGLRMAPEVILLLITHCITETYGRRGGRMPTMRNIEREAYIWEREGIDSLEKAEAHLKDIEERKSARGQVKLALQIRDREFSETEKRYVDKWIEMGFPAGAVGIAYDRTVVKTGKLSWGYMDSIMNNWHGKGLHAPQEILDKDKKQGDSADLSFKKTPGQKFGAADKEDIDRMTRLLEKIKEG